MVFIYAILLPRYLRLTGSIASTVILIGLSYAAMHLFEAWGDYSTPGNAVLTLSFVMLQYVGPGMVKVSVDHSHGQRLGARLGVPRDRPAR